MQLLILHFFLLFYIYHKLSFYPSASFNIFNISISCWWMAMFSNPFSFQYLITCNKPCLDVSGWLPAAARGSLTLAGLWCLESPGANPSTSWKLLLCLPHIWWICMAASRSATRSRSCWARWALSCLISNWKEKTKEKTKKKGILSGVFFYYYFFVTVNSGIWCIFGQNYLFTVLLRGFASL